MKSAAKKNLITYLILIFIAWAGIYYGRYLLSEYSNLRVWDYTTLLLMLIGIPFVLVQLKAGLPDFWDVRISNKNRIFIPLFIGILFGLFDMLVFKLALHPQPYDELPPFLQPFPYSTFLYLSGAFEVEVFYRLIPITIFMLIGNYYKNGKHINAFFWTAAILTSSREPFEQLSDGMILIIFYSLFTGFLMNVLQAIYYRKAGFIASMTLRLGHYLIWHILLGIYVEYVELAY